MPKNKDTAKVKKVFRRYLNKKRNKYVRNPEIFPENEVRIFLGINDSSISCCDGLAERARQYRTSRNLNDYDLLELKGRNFDTRHGDIGQTQMNITMELFKRDMNPRKAYAFIKEGGWLQKKGYYVKDGLLCKSVGGKEEKLKNDVPFRVYYYDNQYNVYRK